MNFAEMSGLARSLNREAHWLITNYLLGGAALGLALGLGNYFFAESSTGGLSILVLVCAGAWLGWVVGRKRSLGLRLQAEASQCLAEMAASQKRAPENLARQTESNGTDHREPTNVFEALPEKLP
jgi:hypothetical protein